MVYANVTIFICEVCGSNILSKSINTADPNLNIAKCPECGQEYEMVHDVRRGRDEIRLKRIN